MAISDTIQSMYENVGEVYDTITNVTLPEHKNIENIPRTIRDSYLEIINNGINVIYDNWEKVIGEGTSLTLTPTEEAPMKIVYKGNTYQDSTTGKNLFDESQLLNATGWTLNSNGYYNGLIDKYYVAFRNGFTFNTTFEENTQYTIQVNAYCTGGSPRFRVDYTDNTYSQINLNATTPTDYTFTTTSGKTISKIVGEYGTGSSQTLYLKNIQLEKGTTKTSYEPYTNGASPNPDYPQEIQVVSGDNSIEVCGKNKFNINGDINTRYDGGTPSNPQNTVLNSDLTTITNTNNFHPFGQKIYVGAGNTIYFSAKLKSVSYSTTPSGSASVGAISIYNDSTPTGRKTLSYTYSELNTYKSDSFTATTDYIYLCFGRSGNVNSTTFTDIMLSSSNDTTYYPYTGASYPINLPVENLFDLDRILGTPSNTSYDNITKRTYNLTEYVKGIVSSNYYDYTKVTTPTISNDSITFTSTSGGYGVGFPFLLKENTEYTISLNANQTGDRLIRIGFYKQDGTHFSSINGNANETKLTFTTPSETYYTLIILTAPANVETTFSNIQLEEGSKANHYTPYGTTPIELCKIGTYQDKIDKSTGKNLLQTDTINYASSGTYNLTLGNNLEIGTYSFSGITNASSGAFVLYGIDENDTQDTLLANKNWSTISTGYNFTTTKKYVSLKVYTNASATGYLMLNEGTTALPYEPYGTSWYLKKEIGKYTFTGNESWVSEAYGVNTWICNAIRFSNYVSNQTQILSNIFNGTSFDGRGTSGDNIIFSRPNNEGFTIRNTTLTTLNAVQSATNGNYIIYQLPTPTYTLIEGELLNQLETIKMSYEGQTNLSQTNNDLPFILNPSALKKV